MSKTSVPARVISVLLAFVLACTMIPTTSIAYAAPADSADATQSKSSDVSASSQAVAQNGEDTADKASSADTSDLADESANSSASDNSSIPSDADSAAAPISSAAQTSGDSSVAGTTPTPAITSNEQPVATTPQDVNMLSTNVSLNNSSTVLTSGNLTYAVNADNTSVTLTGWTGTAPKDAFSIPAQVTVGTATYKVTAVNSAWGGGQTFRAKI